MTTTIFKISFFTPLWWSKDSHSISEIFLVVAVMMMGTSYIKSLFFFPLAFFCLHSGSRCDRYYFKKNIFCKFYVVIYFFFVLPLWRPIYLYHVSFFHFSGGLMTSTKTLYCLLFIFFSFFVVVSDVCGDSHWR